MTTQKCPKCREENPAEAVMCWACYTPLPAGEPSAIASVEKISTGAKIKNVLSDAAPFAGIAGALASGWLPRAARWPVLGAGLSVVGAPLLWSHWKARAADDEPASEGDKPPIERIAETILYYALMEKATETRIEVRERGVDLYYQIEGEWRNQMKIPLYAWKPLRQQLLQYVRRSEFNAGYANHPSWEGTATRLNNFRAQMEVSEQGETLRFQFERALINEDKIEIKTDKLPDIGCLRCKDSNLPGAVWCWNCGDSLDHQTKARDANYRLFSALVLAGFGVAASSGWWARRARAPILGAGALVAAAPLALEKLNEFQTRKINRENERRGITPGYEAPVVHLANQILVRSIKNRLPEIQLRECGNVIVSYQSGETWRQAATLPAYVWLALRTALLDRARATVTCQGKRYDVSAELSSDAEGETMVLRLGAAK